MASQEESVGSKDKVADRLKRIEDLLLGIHEVVAKHSVQLKSLESQLKDDLLASFKGIQKESIDDFNSKLVQTLKALRDGDDSDDGSSEESSSIVQDDPSPNESSHQSRTLFGESAGVEPSLTSELLPTESLQVRTGFGESAGVDPGVEPSLTSYGDSQSLARVDFDSDHWRQAGEPRIPVRLLKGVGICELAESGYYSESELCEAFPSGVVHAAVMRAQGNTATDCKRASLSPKDCLAGGFTTEELVAGGYSETLLRLLSAVPEGALAEAVTASAARGGGGSSAPVGDVHSDAGTAASASVSGSGSCILVNCQKQHGLRTYRAHNQGFTCDGCSKPIPAFTVGKGCRICNVRFLLLALTE
jgi:hypothetical protein